MATSGQFYWPSVGTFVAAYGQFFMAANTSDTRYRRTEVTAYIGSGDAVWERAAREVLSWNGQDLKRIQCAASGSGCTRKARHRDCTSAWFHRG
ncbi:DUF1990 family protein [Pseudarthrobacter siccitolerans]